MQLNKKNVLKKGVIDLHCDLLTYLAGDPKRTPYDRASRCAISQMREGNVCLQTLAVFTQTEKGSSQKGMHQVSIYQKLPSFYPHDLAQYIKIEDFQSDLIKILMAFENASGFCSEEESFEEGIKRLNEIVKNIGKPLYISLTWNTENRFGGGAATDVGLKSDGKRLLEEINQKKIAIDLSHASDRLAHDVIDYIEINRLDISLIASHSNARVIADMPRNLPNDIAKEIFRRKGTIGLNLFRHFVGTSEEAILKHIGHWLELGGENHIAFGADFFYDPDLPSAYRYGKEVFFNTYQNASCYKNLISFLCNELKLSSEIEEKLSYRNALEFINR